MRKKQNKTKQPTNKQKKKGQKVFPKHQTPLLFSCLMEINCNQITGILKSSSSFTTVVRTNCEMLKGKLAQVENCWNIDVLLLASICLV